MGSTTSAFAPFGTAFSGLVVMVTIAAACGGKSHVDVDILGDAAVTGPPGTQACGACASPNVCLLSQCVRPCQSDQECVIGDRCLRTSQSSGCVHSAEIDCSTCTLGGAVCVDGECRTQCSLGCLGDQFCRGLACYGNDAQHDPAGPNPSAGSTTGTFTSSGAGGSTGAGGGGQGGSIVSQCSFLTESCSLCMCTSCPSPWQTCNNDGGCQMIEDCARRTGCRTNCYQPGVCQEVIDANGGPSGLSFSRLSTLASCANNFCQGPCASGGPGVDSGMPSPSAGWWRFDEGSGSTSADESGNGHPAMLVNFPSWQPGITGSAINLDGATQYASLLAGPIVGASPSFTIEAWINWTGTFGQQSVYSEANVNDVLDLYLDNGVATFSVFTNNSLLVVKGRNVPPSSWHQLAAVLQPGVGGTLYFDGQIVGSNPAMGSVMQGIFETDIGRLGGPGSSRYFRGAIDEVHVFLIARSSQEISDDYKSSLTGP